VNFSSSPAGSGGLKAEAGDHGLRAVLGKDVVHSRHKSLIGQSLPDLSELGVSPNGIDLAEKRLLICFWDIEQRPSRHIVQQLSKTAEKQSEQDLVVLLIQTAQVEQDSFDQWLINNEVPFKRGMLKGNFEEKKQDWGVQSLPWMVLTDRARTVHAEGISLGELQGHVNALAGKGR